MFSKHYSLHIDIHTLLTKTAYWFIIHYDEHYSVMATSLDYQQQQYNMAFFSFDEMSIYTPRRIYISI